MMLFDQVLEAVQAIRQHTVVRPKLAIILGSGLGDLASQLTEATSIAYRDIPHFAQSTVVGHVGRLIIGLLEGVPVVAMQGRFHLYEGYTPQVITFPVRVMQQLGAQVLLVSNAAGGVNPAYRPGHFMLIRDHIFLPGLAGMHPLVGPHDERLGARFPALAKAYDRELGALARATAQGIAGVTLHEGVYTMVAGPSYETGAELAYLRTIGTDAVGMSTAPEVVVARQAGMRVLGISLITNAATGSETEEVNHEEVLTTADAAQEKFAELVCGIVRNAVPVY